MSNPSPGGADELSHRLRALRDAAGPGAGRMTQTEAATRSGISQPQIAKYERGQLVPRPEQVEKLCAAYQAPAQERRAPGRTGERPAAPRASSGVVSGRRVDPEANRPDIEGVPLDQRLLVDRARWLFQTAACVHTLFSSEDGARARLENQKMLDDSWRRFEYVLTEGALGGTVLPPEQAAQHMEHLVELSTRPNVRPGIVPFGTPLPRLPANSWEMFDERGDRARGDRPPGRCEDGAAIEVPPGDTRRGRCGRACRSG